MVNSGGRVTSGDRILVVEPDPVLSDLIGRQALQSAGHQVQIATDATTAISSALQWAPDLVLLDLNLSGLSGKDLMVAFASQGVQAPLIVIAQRGSEADIIQTFRLGAADYLLLPIREAEVMNAVNRVLQQVHDRRDREKLSLQLQQANRDMQARVRELTTIFSVGKAVTSITDPSYLMEKILDAATRTIQADIGWLLMREDVKKPFVLAAERNLNKALGTHIDLNQPWDDGISSLVAMSGEALTIHGEPLRRFKISTLGQSAMIVPIKAQKNVIGLLVMLRKQPAPFGSSEQHLLGALADYASISLVNARLFRALENRARLLQQMAETAQLSGNVNHDLLTQVNQAMAGSVHSVSTALEQLRIDQAAHWSPAQLERLAVVQTALRRAAGVTSMIQSMQPLGISPDRGLVNLVDLAGRALRQAQELANQINLTYTVESLSPTVTVYGDTGLLACALDGVINQVVQMSKPGGQIFARIEKLSRPDAPIEPGQKKDTYAHIFVRSSSLVITAKEAEKLFDEKTASPANQSSGGLGIRLSLVKEIIARYGGTIWIEAQPGSEQGFHIRLPGI